MLKIGIDTTPLFDLNAYRGVGFYTRNLIQALEKFSDEVKLFKGNWKDFSSKVDVIHFPYFDFYFRTLPFYTGRKTIVTVHDCIPLVFPSFYPPGVKGKINFFFQKTGLRKKDFIITDSESSKKDIINFLRISPERISVIYLAASPEFKKISSGNTLAKKIKEQYNLPDYFVLYVGDVNWNKNIPGLIRSFKILKSEILPKLKKSSEEKYKIISELKLVMVGKAFENKSLLEFQNILKLIDSLGIKKEIKFLGFVPTPELVILYNLATVYCQPSFYEGFGLQILEAMTCGCPVITSNVSSLPEIANNAAILIDPLNDKDLAEAIFNVSVDSKKRQELRNLGLKNIKNYSWEKTAKLTIDIYKKVYAQK